MLAVSDSAEHVPAGAALSRGGGAFPTLGREISSFRTRYSRTFESPNGGYIARIYEQPVNFKAADGSWQPINDQLAPAGAGVRNRADSYRAFLPSALGAEAMSFATRAGSMSMRLLGAAGRASVSADRAVYHNALPGVSLSYEALPGRLKESVTLASPAAAQRFSFRLTFASGLHPALGRGDSVRVLDRRGRMRFLLPAPWMSDASASRPRSPKRLPGLGRVRIGLTRSPDGWLLTLSPDRAWLRARGRRWPVVIDPTVQDLPASGDCSIAGGFYANTAFCSPPQQSDYVGYNGVPWRTLMNLFAASSLPADVQVTSARFGVYVTGLSGASSLQLSSYAVGPEAYSWDTQVTWNTTNGQTPWRTPGGDFNAQPLDTTTVSGPGWAYFYATALVQSWIDGSAQTNSDLAPEQDGIILKEPLPESSSGLVSLVSGEQTPAPSTQPYMDVAYVPRLGEPRGATIERTQLDDRTSLGVNVANGNVIVGNLDLHVTGTGLDEVIDRTYNNLSPFSQELGHGWVMANALHPYVVGVHDGVDYYGPDGGVYFFAWNPVLGKYDTPPGIDATFCAPWANSGCSPLSGSPYLLEFRDGSYYSFNGSGLLVGTADQNGNQISYGLAASGMPAQITDTQGRTTTFDYGANPYLITGVTDSAGSRGTAYSIDPSGNLTSYTDAAGSTTGYGYDAAGNLTQITDPAGHVTKLPTTRRVV